VLTLLVTILQYVLLVILIVVVVETLIMIQDAHLRITRLRQAHEYALQAGKGVLNISCGHTNYGHVNCDIADREVPNFVKAVPGEPLPFPDKHFAAAYSAHTLEHVDSVEQFLGELHRVADRVYLIYPLADLLWWNPDHKWIFYSRNPKHYVRNPFFNPKNRPYPSNFIIKYWWDNRILPHLERLAQEQGTEIPAELKLGKGISLAWK
jgi:SAM-dependent methyltransferase